MGTNQSENEHMLNLLRIKHAVINPDLKKEILVLHTVRCFMDFIFISSIPHSFYPSFSLYKSSRSIAWGMASLNVHGSCVWCKCLNPARETPDRIPCLVCQDPKLITITFWCFQRAILIVQFWNTQRYAFKVQDQRVSGADLPTSWPSPALFRF